MHHHDMYQIEFVSAGEGTLKLNNKEYPAKRGLMYAIRLRDYHAYEVSETLTVHRIILPMKCMPEKMSYGMLKSKVDIITHLDEEPSKHIENLFLMLESRREALFKNEIFIQEWLINIIVTEFFERAKYRPEDVYVSDADKVDRVMVYIEDNFRKKLTIADVAAEFKMNPNYLNRIFKEQKGITLYAAVKNARLEYSKKLLTDTELPIAEVSKTCGYSDGANFLRDFKKMTGVAPLRYRKLKGVVNEKLQIDVLACLSQLLQHRLTPVFAGRQISRPGAVTGAEAQPVQIIEGAGIFGVLRFPHFLGGSLLRQFQAEPAPTLLQLPQIAAAVLLTVDEEIKQSAKHRQPKDQNDPCQLKRGISAAGYDSQHHQHADEQQGGIDISGILA